MSEAESATAEPVPGNASARVMIVDDHPIVRQGYAQLIGAQSDMEVCGYADSETEALTTIEETQPNLAVIDLSLKNSHGIELIKQVRAKFPTLRMLVISAHDESLFAERSLEAGALGYINKQEAIANLVDGIRKVLNDEVYLSDAMTRRLLKRRIGRNASQERPAVAQLSDRELEVFELIGQGLTTRRIASQLEVSPKTIERYRENIKQKLDLGNATELVRRATQWVLENK